MRNNVKKMHVIKWELELISSSQQLSISILSEHNNAGATRAIIPAESMKITENL